MRLGISLALVLACGEVPTDEAPSTGVVSAALGPDATVAEAIASECSTGSIRGLGQQLIDEVQCQRPGTFSRIDDIEHVVLGEATFPWLQSPAADALRAVASERDAVMTINSAYRTVAQQLMLYQWYRDGKRCGIALAAAPGNSNHESALAVDVDEYSAWRAAFEDNDFRWLGGSDPVHFDYAGDADVVDLRVLSVSAFQRLWNRNHPDDPIEEDGDYGPATEARILAAPAAGFALGAPCVEPPIVAEDAGAADAALDASAPPIAVEAGDAPFTREPTSLDGEGCSSSGRSRPSAVVLVALLAVLVRRQSARRR